MARIKITQIYRYSPPPYPGVVVALGCSGSLTTAVVRTVTVVRVGGTTGGETTFSVVVLWTGVGNNTVVSTGGVSTAGAVPVLLPCWPVLPMVSVTVSTTVSVMAAQTVGIDGVPVVRVPVGGGTSAVVVVVSLPEGGGVPDGVPGVSGLPGVGVPVGGTSTVAVVSLPEGGVPDGVPGVSGLPGVGVSVGGTSTVVVVSLPEGGTSTVVVVSLPEGGDVPGTLGVGVSVGGITVMMVVPLPKGEPGVGVPPGGTTMVVVSLP